MPETTPQEAAEKLEWLAEHRLAEDNLNLPDCKAAAELAASYLRKIASGEYAPVVHARWNGWTTTAYIGSKDEFGDPKYAERKFFRCSNCRYGSVVQSNYCPSCGALMDEKEDGQ